VLPSQIVEEIARLTQENSRGAEALYEAEVALAQAEHDLDLIEQKAFIKTQGTVADRTALAKLESADARLQRDLKRAQLNRIKVKIKTIETTLMALGTQVKLIQSEMR
jgi:NADPH-dependent 7-cyano-7-deazaguanine reductase QueF-like protein